MKRLIVLALSTTFVIQTSTIAAIMMEDNTKLMPPPNEEMTQRILNEKLKSSLNKKDVNTAIRLIKNGANPNTQDDKGNSLLIFATYNKMIDPVKILLTNSLVDVNCKNEEGCTSLMFALMEGDKNIELIRMLLAHEGIDVNLQDKDGYTALMYALLYLSNTMYFTKRQADGQLYNCSYVKHVIIQLLSRGVSVLPKTKNGKDAIFFAKSHKHSARIIETLEKLKLEQSVTTKSPKTPPQDYSDTTV